MSDEVLNMKQRQAMEILLGELRTSRPVEATKEAAPSRILPRRVVRAAAGRSERGMVRI